MEDNNPLVSIITGYYNRTTNLRSSIQSVLNQTYDNFEYLVFDDCSDDGTYQMLREYEGHPKFRLIRHERNIGLTNGLISTIAMAKGDYIAIHGAGDISYADRIKCQVDKFLSNEEIGVVSCYFHDCLYEEPRMISVRPIIKWNENLKIYNQTFSHGEIMIKKDYYNLAGGYRSQIKYGQLKDLMNRMSSVCRFDICETYLYKRIQFKNGVNRDINKKIKQKYFQILSHICTIQRNKYGIDIIDKHGDLYVNYFSYQDILSLIYLSPVLKNKDLKEEEFKYILYISKNEKINFMNRFISLVGYRTFKNFPSKLLSHIYVRYIKWMLSRHDFPIE